MKLNIGEKEFKVGDKVKYTFPDKAAIGTITHINIKDMLPFISVRFSDCDLIYRFYPRELEKISSETPITLWDI